MLNKDTAEIAERNYAGSYHRVWKDADGKTLLEAKTRRYSRVSINYTALERFREQGGDFVGLACPDYKKVVPLSKLDAFKPFAGDDFILVGKDDLDHSAAPTKEDYPF